MTELSSAESAAERYHAPATGSISRWALQTPGIDVFWPILAVVLTTFVILVASVAHSSMAAVGVDNPRTDWSPIATPAASAPFMIVQVSSNPTRLQAQAKAQKLRQSGLDAGVLLSDRYPEMHAGWYVVYVGPFEATAGGREQARAISKQIDGSFVRTVHRR